MNHHFQNTIYQDFNSANKDWKGERSVDNIREIVEFQNNSSIRIWLNEQYTDFALHWHHALELIIPVENYYDVIAGDVPYHILSDEILLIPPGVMHQLIAPPKGKRFIFLFDISYLAKLKGFSGIQSSLTSSVHITKNSHPNTYNSVYSLLVQIRNEYFNGNEYSELMIYSLLIKLFVHLGRNHINNNELFPNVRPYKQKEYVQKFNNLLEYIDAHYTDDMTLEEAASMIGFSKYHFTRLFKQYTNYTFYDYLYYRRLKCAEELLTRDDLSITDIALYSGFPSLSSFNRNFKKQKNCTPSEYRALFSNTNLHNS